tara:strand:- start:489 stop:1118 length:630 start_codon:yes stop_codon:yes gene_type:complete
MNFKYEKNGEKIYKKSFSIIRSETNLGSFSKEEEKIVVRMIHASGFTSINTKVKFSKNFVKKAKEAVNSGGNIICDTNMIKSGITKSRLPADNSIICTLNEKEVFSLSKKIGNTRTAAAVELWGPYLKGSLVAIGNAPTCLFHLLELLRNKTLPEPEAIIGFPVGFVGAVESKDDLFNNKQIECCIIKGRLGGSAMTVAAVNAILSEKE